MDRPGTLSSMAWDFLIRTSSADFALRLDFANRRPRSQMSPGLGPYAITELQRDVGLVSSLCDAK